MSDDQNQNPQTPVTSLPPEQQQAIAQHQKEVNQLIEVGQAQFNATTFDESSQVVRDALGDRTAEFVTLAKQFDKPADIIVHLASNEKRLQQFAKLSTARQIVELGRIEAQLSSHGYVPTGADPLWRRQEARNGRVSDDDWARGADHLTDAQWFKESARRDNERGDAPRVSTEAMRWAERVKGGSR
jgi:hypothetical protein